MSYKVREDTRRERRSLNGNIINLYFTIEIFRTMITLKLLKIFDFHKMNFLKFSFLLVFISLIVGLTPTLLKSFLNNNQMLGTAVLGSKANGDFVPKSDKPIRILIVAENVKIPVYIADDNAERAKGLGGLASIPRDYGMFFVFDTADYQGIWMKDMLFPIDIIWIDENLRISHIEKNISPDTYPKIFTSPVKASYVLELNAGMSDSYNLKTGENIILI